MDSVSPTVAPEKGKPGRRRKHRAGCFFFLAIIFGGLWGFFLWIPWEYDFRERIPPMPNPKIAPEPEKLFAKGTKVLIITAHPDDSEFYTGGTLAKLRDAGAEIWQVITTDGDKSFYGPFTNVTENRRVRREESLAAAKAWGGTNLVMLGYPDGRLANSQALVDRLRQEIDKFQPEYVLSFDYDFPPRRSHKDHRITGQAVALALEKPSSVRWLMRFSTDHPNYVEDISTYWPEKEKFLMIHKSQFGEKSDFIVDMVKGRAIKDGEIIDKRYGEGFRVIQMKQ